MDLNSEQWFVLVVMSVVVILLIWDRIKSSIVFSGAALLLLITGALSTQQFLSAFANPSVIVIFLLIFLTAVFREHFDLVSTFDKLFGASGKKHWFIIKMTAGVSLFSSFMNNTPIVAVLTPYVYQWGKRNGVSPSKLLIPLSYAAILGGMITVIGTSTNLVLNGFITESGGEPLSIADFFIPGVLVSAMGVVYLSTIGQRLLPAHEMVMDEQESAIRNYLFETKLQSDSDLQDKSVLEAGLRNLDGLFLAEILREDEYISPVTPETVLRAGDRLYFAGDREALVELIRTDKGVTWAKNDEFELDGDVQLVEAVVSYNSFLAGKTLKEAEFRERFDAAVVAIHRNGASLKGKLGAVTLEPGDMLLMTTGSRFAVRNARYKDLYVVSELDHTVKTPDWKKASMLLGVLAVVALVMSGITPLLHGLIALVALAGLLGMTGLDDLKKHLNMDLFLILGSAIAVGSALIESGVADQIAKVFVSATADLGPKGILTVIFLLTCLLTSFVTNVAAISIVFPIVFGVTHNLGVDPLPYYLSAAFAASAAFLTPVAYQTNLMVYGPGNYRFRDFMKVGLPMTIIYAIIIISYLTIQYSL